MTAVAQSRAIPFLDAASNTNDSREFIEQAKLISDQIDAAIAKDKALRKARKDAGDVSLLLLGQSESGKSTLLKQFQLLHSQSSFDEERSTWRPVILLNVLNTVRNLLSLINEQKSQSGLQLDDESLSNLQQAAPELYGCEEKLVKVLVSTGHVQASDASRSTTSKGVYMRRRQTSTRSSIDNDRGSGLRPLTEEDRTSLEVISTVMQGQQDNIRRIWSLPKVKRVVSEFLQEDWRGYFISDLPRITATTYIPSDDDIMHVRIMTMGVVEHAFRVVIPQPTVLGSAFKRGPAKEFNLNIYDVGGARGQRHAWASYFEDSTAIIFLAPLSAFDQYLAEDMEVNRIQDSLELFQKICDNPVLGKTEIVLFLNKIDLLAKKLADGVKIATFIPSYGDQPNDVKVAQKYFSGHFQAVFQRSKGAGVNKRGLFIHYTSVVDTKATRVVIGNVQDAILKAQLKDAKLM